jgi:hypothetical protein
MTPGEVFNPWRKFLGVFVPEPVCKSREISAGAKLVYGRLARFGGEEGNVYPSIRRIGDELGISMKQARRYVRELEQQGFIKSTRTPGKVSRYAFIWQAIFDGAATLQPQTPPIDGSTTPSIDGTPKDGTPIDGSRRESGSSREPGSSRESSDESQVNSDLDFPPTGRKSGGPQPGDGAGVTQPTSEPKQYPKVREALATYMGRRPSDRFVVEVMHVCEGENEAEVCEALHFLYEERGLKPGTRYGPRSWKWFLTTLAEYFTNKLARDQVANPDRFPEPKPKIFQDEFKAMSEPLEAA